MSFFRRGIFGEITSILEREFPGIAKIIEANPAELEAIELAPEVMIPVLVAAGVSSVVMDTVRTSINTAGINQPASGENIGTAEGLANHVGDVMKKNYGDLNKETGTRKRIKREDDAGVDDAGDGGDGGAIEVGPSLEEQEEQEFERKKQEEAERLEREAFSDSEPDIQRFGIRQRRPQMKALQLEPSEAAAEDEPLLRREKIGKPKKGFLSKSGYLDIIIGLIAADSTLALIIAALMRQGLERKAAIKIIKDTINKNKNKNNTPENEDEETDEKKLIKSLSRQQIEKIEEQFREGEKQNEITNQMVDYFYPNRNSNKLKQNNQIKKSIANTNLIIPDSIKSHSQVQLLRLSTANYNLNRNLFNTQF